MSGSRRAGGWLPDQDTLDSWLEDLTQKAMTRPKDAPLHPVMEEFRHLIDQDPIVRMYLTQMIEQAPHVKSSSRWHLESVEQMLLLIDEVIGQAPEYNESGLVGLPVNAIIDGCMATPAGYAAFRHEAINAMLRKILQAWCDFLSSPDSLYVLNDSPQGWKCASARKSTKIEQFQHDPHEKHWGFRSWNDFFTRRFKPGQRPVAEPENDKVIVNACEATPYAISSKVKRHHSFWIKSQPYSLRDLLAGDEAVEQLAGGTVFQAFLDAHSYHRWHSPISGTIRKAFIKEGTYYSEAESVGDDPLGPKNSQGYVAHTATRAIFLIEADDPSLGLMGLIPVGMSEVSSCVIHGEMRPGRRVRKGEELGYFQYGGSTYCLVFGPGAVSEFALEAIPDPHTESSSVVLVGAKIATAS